MTQQQKITLHAERYASPQMPVFPCKGKEPLLNNWPEIAVTDPLHVGDIFTKHPTANLAIVTGNGMFVVDIDGDQGHESLAKLEAHNGKLPETWTAITGKGTHYYFASTEPIRNSTSKLAPSIDIRGKRGYVIAPPSIHPETLTAYEWEIAPTDQPIAKAPQWLIDALLKTKPEKPQHYELQEPSNVEEEADHYYQKACAAAPTKGRNVAGFDFVCQLRDLRIDEDQCRNYMTIYHDTVKDCRPGQPYLIEHAMASVVQAFSKPPRDPGLLNRPTAAPTEWPEPEPITETKPPEFPTIAFNSVPLIKELIEKTAEVTHTAVDFSANIVIGAVAAATQGKVRVMVSDKSNWSEPTSLLIIICGQRGSGKSQVFRPLTDIIYQLDMKDSSKRLSNSATTKAEIMALEQEKKAILKRMQQEPDPEATQRLADVELNLSRKVLPSTSSAILSDVTPEKAAIIASGNGGRLVLASAEGVPLNSLKSKYSEQDGEQFLTLLLNGHAGDKFTQGRVGRSDINISEMAVSAILFTQPESFKKNIIRNEYYTTRGLNARWLIACPEFRPESLEIDITSDNQPTVPNHATKDYERRITELWNISQREQDGKNLYYYIKMDYEARAITQDFQNNRIKPMFLGCSAYMQEALVKARGTVARLSCILHCLEHGDDCINLEISGSNVSDAILIYDYYLTTYEFMNSGSTQRDIEMLSIIKWIKVNNLEEIDSRTMNEKLKHFDTGKDNILKELEELGYIRPEKINENGRGRPKIIYKTNPKLRET